MSKDAVIITVNGRPWNINPIIWRPDGSYVVNLQNNIGYHIPNPAALPKDESAEWTEVHAAIEQYIQKHPGEITYLDDWDFDTTIDQGVHDDEQ